MASGASGDYILGTDPGELERLRFQHGVWAEELRGFCLREGLGAGATVLDLGCGPGFTSLELARIVGTEGRVIARDKSPRFLGFLRQECGRLGLPQVEASEGPVEDLDLPGESLDAVYARWLLCWLPRPGEALARVAPALRPGGRVLVHDYLDWGSMRLLPRSDAFDRGIAACLGWWRSQGLDVDVAERLPDLAGEAGLRLASLRPLARLARPGSPEWVWLGSFLLGYLRKIAGEGALGAGEADAFRAAFEERSATGRGWIATPTMAEAVLVRE